MRKTWIAVLVSLARMVAAETPDGAGIVYGKDIAFAIQAPSEWVLDNRAGKSQGLPVVFYQQGKTWQNAEVAMYANMASKRVRGQETLRELMDYDIAQFATRAPGLKVTAAPEIKAVTTTATISWFEGDAHGNHEAVAYIDEKHTIVMLVLSARKKARFEAAYPVFEELVRSYRFLTSKVEVEK